MVRLKFVAPDRPFPLEGVTVRKGTKWDMPVGGEVSIVLCEDFHFSCTECAVLGPATIMAKYVGPLSNMPREFLALEHNRSAQTILGLLESMRRIYGENTITPSTIVTALHYDMEVG